MPIVGTNVGEGNAFDSAGYILTQTRAIVNDLMEDAGGDILTNDWFATWVYLNQAYRICQHDLANNGVETNAKEVHMSPLVACPVSDPEQQVWISQSGYYNGVTNFANPSLPADMIIPLRLWERFAGTQNPFIQVTPSIDGLPSGMVQCQQFRFWDWRGSAIYLPGASQSNELRLRYIAYFPELTDANSVVVYPRMAVALAYMTAYCFAQARGSAQAPAMQSMAQNELDQIVSQTTRKKQRKGASKRPYCGNNSRSGSGW
jgi:hypothetical protein